MRRFLLNSMTCLSLACVSIGYVGQEAQAASSGAFEGKGQSSIVAELPAKDEIQLNSQDIVLHADFENYVEAAEDSLPLYASDFFALNNKISKYLDENLSEEEIESTAAYIYTARGKGYDNRLTLDGDLKNKVLEDIESKAYNIDVIAFEQFPKIKTLYLKERSALSDAKAQMVAELYAELDVVGFIKSDQQSRECKLEDAEENTKCREVKEALIKVLDKKDFQDECKDDAVRYMSAHYDSKSLEFAKNYHDVVDLETVKFIIEDEEYDREKLREYMDGALMELYKRGYHPKDEKNMEISRALHPTIMRRCVSLLGKYK